MSWELAIRGGKTIGLAAWNTRLRALGVSLEHDPQFGMHHCGECFTFAMTISSDARFRDAARFARFGPIAAHMQFEVHRYGPLDRRIDAAALATALDHRIARLGELGAPDVVLEHEHERRASLRRAMNDEPDEQHVYVWVPDGHLLVHTLASAAYALACGGEVQPYDSGGSFAGDAILGWMANRLSTYALSDPEPFRGWK
jgi:hypothetical protein